MGVEMARLLLAMGVAAGLTACDRGDKGNTAMSQASGMGAANAAEAPLNTIDRRHAGTPAPAVAFEARGGTKTSLADFKGRRVLVNLWATWCAPCVAEMPALDAAAGAAKDRLVVLPISQDMEGWRTVDKFFAKGKFRTLQPYLDQPGNFAEKLAARGLPMSVLYDEKGREVWRVAGTLKWESPEVAKALEAGGK